MIRISLYLLCTLLGLAVDLQAQHTGPSAALPAIGAPSEAAQFDFLIGQWEVELTPKVNGLAAMIHGTPQLLGTWKAWKALDGFGIDDELRIVDGSGNPVALTHARRIYDKANARWVINGLDVYRARFNVGIGRWQEGKMRLHGNGVDGEGKPYRARTLFDDIGADGFRMRQDRSYDGGATWDEATITMVAKRVADVAPR